MLTLRRSADRAHFNHGWLDTYHTFSFGDFYDPAQMGFRVLRVINEDRIAPGGGFGMHGHRDMEIVTLVLSSGLAHQDSLGHGETLRPGELQRMSAGRGIRHSEFNASQTDPVHLYQIWLLPRAAGLAPSYEQKAFDPLERRGRWQLVASPTGEAGSLTLQQEARILLADLPAGTELAREIPSGRHAWLQVLRGSLTVNEVTVGAGDAAALGAQPRLMLQTDEPAEVLLFDLA